MNGKEFYEKFKSIIRSFDLRFHDMKLITVSGTLKFTYIDGTTKHEANLIIGELPNE
jgi:hypothetical protein